MKQKMKTTIFILCGVAMVLGIALTVVGIFLPVPDYLFQYYEEISSLDGSVSNYIIESATRSGEIAGRIAAKAVYVVGGIVLVFLSIAGGIAVSLFHLSEAKEKTN